MGSNRFRGRWLHTWASTLTFGFFKSSPIGRGDFLSSCRLQVKAAMIARLILLPGLSLFNNNSATARTISFGSTGRPQDIHRGILSAAQPPSQTLGV